MRYLRLHSEVDSLIVWFQKYLIPLLDFSRETFPTDLAEYDFSEITRTLAYNVT